MSAWDLTRQKYPTKYELTENERPHLPYTVTDSFATNSRGDRILFARLGNETIYSRGVGYPWKFEEDQDIVLEQLLRTSFVDYGLVNNLNPFTGTAEFRGKEIKYDKGNHYWVYRNNRKVNFHTSERNTPAEEEDTASVEQLLETTKRTIVAATQKLSLGRPSRPPTPQTGSFSGQTRTATALPGSFPINTPKGKTRATALEITAGPSASTSHLPTPPVPTSLAPPITVPQAPPPRGNPPAAPPPTPAAPAPAPVPPAPPLPPGGNPPPVPPPAPAAPMANPPPRAVGTTPDAFDGNPAKAEPFWNALENYYTLNNAVYTNEGQKVAAALMHFKLGTSAGDWASNRLSTALAATPIDYGTWAEFKNKFKEQFIPPQTQVESIQKIHNLPMGSKEFNEWYQEWSMYARQADVDEQTRMYAFRKNLNQSLHQKIVQMSPQPGTMVDLVKAARDLDKNWRMFAGPPRSGPRRLGIRALDDKANPEINAFQGKPKKRGKLTPDEHKYHMDNNLCLYCGKPGHKAQDCRAPPNKFPKAPIRRIETIPEEDKSIEKPDTEINVLDSNQFTLLASLDPDEMNISPDF